MPKLNKLIISHNIYNKLKEVVRWDFCENLKTGYQFRIMADGTPKLRYRYNKLGN